MKGLASLYYKEFGEDMIKSAFAEYADRIAVGLVGEGSECFGFDDALSQDHDFEPGFCLWITAEDEKNSDFDSSAPMPSFRRSLWAFVANRSLPQEEIGTAF